MPDTAAGAPRWLGLGPTLARAPDVAGTTGLAECAFEVFKQVPALPLCGDLTDQCVEVR